MPDGRACPSAAATPGGPESVMTATVICLLPSPCTRRRTGYSKLSFPCDNLRGGSRQQIKLTCWQANLGLEPSGSMLTNLYRRPHFDINYRRPSRPGGDATGSLYQWRVPRTFCLALVSRQPYCSRLEMWSCCSPIIFGFGCIGRHQSKQTYG
jgi:hypothetical protein